MKMSNKTYDVLKTIALIATPVLAFLATLIGAIVVALNINYKKGIKNE